MKNLIKALSLSALMLALLAVPAWAEETDAFTSASVSNFYADTALAGDELMEAINTFSGFYLVCTTNPDGSPNAAFFIFSCLKNEDKYYLQMGLAENQSKLNLAENGEGVAVYAATPGSGEDAKPYAVAGARMRFVQVTDEYLLAALNTSNSDSALFFEITEVLPLG